jgi:hypothetical protein
MEKTSFVVGIDLGQVSDYTALTIIEKVIEPTGEIDTSFRKLTRTFYNLRHLERPELGTPYPQIVERVKTIMKTEPLVSGDTDLVVDGTGCGRPVVDLFEEAELLPIAVTITGGDQESQDGSDWRVPKKNLVGSLQVAFQTECLKIKRDLPLAPILIKELLNFKAKININAHASFEAWREADHDDCVLATALALWWASRPKIYVGMIPIKGV